MAVVVIVLVILMVGIYLLIYSYYREISKAAPQEGRGAITKDAPQGVVLLDDIERVANSLERSENENVLPGAIASMCADTSNKEFVSINNEKHIFRGKPLSAVNCDGDVWVVYENGATQPNAATLYFDGSGNLLDICQPLFAPSGCEKYEDIGCKDKNYCL